MISPLRKRPWIAAASLLLAVSGPAPAESPGSSAPQAPAADGRVSAALGGVSAERIRASIEKLVSFGTRATLSAQDPASIAAGRGIGAAREWIKAEFERYAKDCSGCPVSYTHLDVYKRQKGIIVTDALDMAGLTRLFANNIGRSAVESFKAGNDLLLIPADFPASYNAMLQAVQSGEISRERPVSYTHLDVYKRQKVRDITAPWT